MPSINQSGGDKGKRERAPRPDGSLIVIGYGTGTQAGDAALHKLAAVLARRRIFVGVRAAVLRGGPSLAAAAQAATAGPIRLLPFLMGGGMTFGQHLGEAMAGISWPEKPLLYPPLSLNPGLAELAARHAETAAGVLSWPVPDSHMLLIAHGTLRKPATSEAARMHQTRLAAQNQFAGVTVAFLDQPPYLDIILSGHGRPLLGVGLFAGERQHGAQDMARAFAKASCPAHICGAIGGDNGLPLTMQA